MRKLLIAGVLGTGLLAGCMGTESESVWIDGTVYVNSNTDAEKIAATTSLNQDRFSNLTTVSGPSLTYMGVRYHLTAKMQGGNTNYFVQALAGGRNGWPRLEEAYILGWRNPIKLPNRGIDVNCTSSGCNQHETVVFPITSEQYRKGLKEGLEISLQGQVNHEFIISKGYFEGFEAVVSRARQ